MPQASIAVQTRTWIDLSANSSSTNPRSSLDIPVGEAEWQEIFQVAVFHVASFLHQDLSNRTVRLDGLGNRLLLDSCVPQEPGGLCSFFARMNKHERLVLACLVGDLFVADFIGDLAPFNRFLLRDTNELLLQTARPIRHIKVENALFLINSKEGCNVFVIGQCSQKAKKADKLRSLFRPAGSPGNDTESTKSSPFLSGDVD